MVRVLIAKTKEGQYFTLIGQVNRYVLRQIRTNHQFYCPQCEEEVLLKVGEFKIPHFSHQKENSCRSLFAEGESPLHLAGKQQLYEFFNQHAHLTTQLEPYMADLAQRPDLLISMGNKQIPIEFQCSRIPIAQIKKRTAGYGKADMDPIWILQTPQKIKQLPQGITMYSLSRFEESFLQIDDDKRSYLLSYDAKFQKFHYLSSLLHVSGRKFIVNHRTLSLSQQNFPFGIPNFLTLQELEHYYLKYASERIKFLKQRILFNRRGVQDSFLRMCYEVKLIPSELPEWIGVPMTTNRLGSEHACEWQLALLYFMHKKNIKTYEVTKEDLHEFIYSSGYVARNMLQVCEKYLMFLLSVDVTSIYTQLSLQKMNKIQEALLQCLQSEMKIEKI